MSEDQCEVKLVMYVEVKCSNRNKPSVGPNHYCFRQIMAKADGVTVEECVKSALDFIKIYAWFVSEDQSIILCPNCKQYVKPLAVPQPVPVPNSTFITLPGIRVPSS